MVRKITDAVNRDVVPLLRSFESEYVNDSYSITIAAVLDRLVRTFSDIDKEANSVANEFVMAVNTKNKDRFYKSIDKALGVNLQSIIQNEGLEDALFSSTRENVSLIKSIPNEYFKKLETIVYTNTTQGTKATSIIKQIRKLHNTTESRAKLIARDQTSKINSALNQQRQQNLGVEEYVWVTSGDERVRPSHARNNGKTFRWDDPPSTGHPGSEIQCRCVAQPVINL